MLLKQKQLCQSNENKWNTKASYYKAFQSLIKTIVCGISKNIFGVVDLKETGGSIEEEGRVVRTGSERTTESCDWSPKRDFFPLLEIVKMLLAPPQCPSYEEEGRGVTWNGGSKPLLFFCYLSSPWASFQTLSWKAFETTRFSIRESFFHKCRCAA